MKPANVYLPLMIFVLLIPSLSGAQQGPMRAQPSVSRVASSPMSEVPQTRMRRVELRDARSETTFPMIGFTFWTGGDDLRDDSIVTASLTFPDGAKQDCPLHGPQYASGAAANISWDNNSTHDAPPCRLDKPRTLRELKKSRIVVSMGSSPISMDANAAIAGGPAGVVAGLHTSDNWNIARVDVKAYDPNGSGGICLRSASGNPLARLTGEQPEVAISDFPNQCR